MENSHDKTDCPGEEAKAQRGEWFVKVCNWDSISEINKWCNWDSNLDLPASRIHILIP